MKYSIMNTPNANSSFQQTEDQLETYRAICALAVLCLLLGLASASVLYKISFLFIPFIAVFVGIIALRQIGVSDGQLAGKWAAVVGLCLAFFFACMGPAQSITQDYLMVQRAKPLADQFIAALLHGEPHKALQLSKPPKTRQPIDEHLWDHFRKDSNAREELGTFVAHPVINTLLALGSQAEVRFFEGRGVDPLGPTAEKVPLVYAATYERAGKKRSFLFALTLVRRKLGKDIGTAWHISDFSGNVKLSPGAF